ncbi:hypothetical protein Tco_0129718, partial [Tanacetum coccineum]
IPVAANEFRSVFGEASTSRSFCKTRVICVESDDGGDDDWTQSSLLKERKIGFGIVTSWREEDLIREIDLYMPISQYRTPKKNIAKVST